MLRLLQKKLTPVQAEFIKHLVFVLSAHGILLLLLVVSTQGGQRMVLNIRTFQKSDNITIQWRSSKKPMVSAAQQSKVHVPAPTKPIKKPAPKPFTLSGQFTKIDLGPKKKRTIDSSYHVAKPPEPEKVIEPVKATVNAVTQEPLVISVHEYHEQQQTLEIVDAIRRWWQPPMGVHPEALCIILVKVSATGACQEVTVQHSSGVPAYDISAKSALLKSNFPKIMWGKQCVLQF